MDLQYFLNVLLRRKWLILATALAAAVAAFFFVDRQPEKFKATTVLSTGIVDVTGIDLSKENPWVQQFYVDMGFGNLVEFITSQRNVIFLTYHLLLHDLAPDTVNSERPFRSLADKEDLDFHYSPEEIQAFRNHLKRKLAKLEYTLDDPKMEVIFHDLSTAYEYDYESLMKHHLNIERKGESDLMHVEFSSENPRLSAFGANVFSKEFLRNYEAVQFENEDLSVKFLADQAQERKFLVDSLRDRLRFYNNQEDLPDLAGQTEALITRIKDLEGSELELKSKAPALRRSIADLDNEIQRLQGNKTNDRAIEMNNRKTVQNLDMKIEEFRTKYIDGGMKDENLKKTIDLLRDQKEKELKRLAKNSPGTEDELLEQRIESLMKKRSDLEIELESVQEGIMASGSDLSNLRGQKRTFVSRNDFINALNQDLEIAENEYKLIYAEYSKEKLNLDNTILPVKIFQHAQIPEKSVPKMRALISGFSGVVGGTLATVLVFLLAFMDNTISSPHKFRKFVDMPLIATVNRINPRKLDFPNLFNSADKNKQLKTFTESIRNLRYQLEQSGGKKFLVTSTKPGEGKTLIMLALAHSFLAKNKRVLLIDTNFKNNMLTRMSQGDQGKLLQTRLLGESDASDEIPSGNMEGRQHLGEIDIIGNKGSHQSPGEVFAGKKFGDFLERMAEEYDVVMLEAAAMNKFTDAKELVGFADRIITVFSGDVTIQSADKNAIDYLKAQGNKLMGAVLNKLDLKNME